MPLSLAIKGLIPIIRISLNIMTIMSSLMTKYVTNTIHLNILITLIVGTILGMILFTRGYPTIPYMDESLLSLGV